MILQILALLPLALATLFAAAYAHRRLPGLCHSARALLFARALLIGTGVGFGLAMVASARLLAEHTGVLVELLVFASSFGVVHVPAALIMLIKVVRRRQGAGPQGPDDWPWRG